MAKRFSLLLGVILLAVGLVGSFTGGHAHNFVIFGINFAHNVVHILSGILALLAAQAGERYAKLYCLAFGIVYGLVAIGGFLNVAALVELLNLNAADNLLHLVIAAACLWVGTQAKAA